MAKRSPESVTQLLERWSQGDEEALGRLMPLVYDELHRLAAAYLRRERGEHTLQPTALIHELYIKLVDQDHPNWKNRAQFFGVAAQLMRRILIDHARRHQASKRGGDRINVSLRNVGFGNQADTDLLTLNDALDQLAKIDPELSRLVELRFFGGLTIEETAEVMGVSHATVERGWRVAKARLKAELTKTTAVR